MPRTVSPVRLAPYTAGMTAPEASSGIVLVADDDALVRAVLRMALSRAGYAVIEASDAAEAVAVAGESAPDLVVLDINMPGGTAVETLHGLRAGHPALPVLVLSGEAHPPADLVGANSDFAHKPIDLDDLLDRVRSLLRSSVDNA